jgi:hypothetical protein
VLHDISGNQLVHIICGLVLHPPLMRAGNAHVLTILGHRTPCHLNTLGLQNASDLVIGIRVRGIFFLDQLLNPALQDEQ